MNRSVIVLMMAAAAASAQNPADTAHFRSIDGTLNGYASHASDSQSVGVRADTRLHDIIECERV